MAGLLDLNTFLVLLRNAAPNIGLYGNEKLFRPLIKLLKDNNIMYANRQDDFADNKCAILKKSENFIVVAESRFFPRIKKVLELRPEMKLGLIEVGLACKIAKSGCVLALRPIIQSSCLEGLSFFGESSDPRYEQLCTLIESNGGQMATKINAKTSYVICGTFAGQRTSTEGMLKAMGKYKNLSVKGKDWLNVLKVFNNEMPNEFSKKNFKNASLLEPFLFYFSYEDVISSKMIKMAENNGLDLQVSKMLTNGCIVVYNKKKDQNVLPITKDAIIYSKALILSDEWLKSVIRENKFVEYECFVVPRIIRDRFSSMPSYSAARVKILNVGNVAEMKRVVSILGGEIEEKDYNLLICPDFVSQQREDVELSTYSCVRKYSEEMLPHICDYTCIPLALNKISKLFINGNGDGMTVAFDVREREREYLKCVVPKLGGIITDLSESADILIVNPQIMTSSQQANISDNTKLLKTKLFEDLVVKNVRVRLEDYYFDSGLESSSHHSVASGVVLSQCVDITGSQASSVPPNRSPPYQSATQEVEGSSASSSSQPSRTLSLDSDFSGRELIMQELLSFLNLFGISSGKFEAELSSNILRVDVEKTLESADLDFEKGRSCVAGVGPCWRNSDCEKITSVNAVYKSASESTRDNVRTKMLEMLPNFLRNIGISCVVVQSGENTISPKFKVYACIYETECALIAEVFNVDVTSIRGFQILFFEKMIECIQVKGKGVSPLIHPIQVLFLCMEHEYINCRCEEITNLIKSWKTVRGFCTSYKHWSSVLNPPVIIRLKTKEKIVKFAGRAVEESRHNEEWFVSLLTSAQKKYKDSLYDVQVFCENCVGNQRPGKLTDKGKLCYSCHFAKACYVRQPLRPSQPDSLSGASSSASVPAIIDVKEEVNAAIGYFEAKFQTKCNMKERRDFLKKKLEMENFRVDTLKTIWYNNEKDNFYLIDSSRNAPQDLLIICVDCYKGISYSSKTEYCICMN